MDALDEAYERARELSEQGLHMDAAALFRQIAEQVPNFECVAFYLLSANEFLLSGEIDEAIKYCRRSFAKNPKSSQAWRSLGVSLVARLQDGEAEQALLKSIALGASPTAYVYLADLCIRQGRFIEGEMFCRKSLELCPDFDEALYYLGLVMRKQQRLEPAIDALQTAIKISPNYHLAHREISGVFLEMNVLDKAEKHALIAHQLAPNDADTNDLMARIRGQ